MTCKISILGVCVWLIVGLSAATYAQTPDVIADSTYVDEEAPDTDESYPSIDSSALAFDSIVWNSLDSELLSSPHYSALTFFVRPQMLLHRHPQLTAGIEVRPSDRLAILVEYGHGLNYSVFEPQRYTAQNHYKVRGALHFYRSNKLRSSNESYRGIDFFYHPLEFITDRNVLQVRGDVSRKWYRLENARVNYPTMSVGYVSGTVYRFKRFSVFLESSTGLRYFDTRIVSADKNELIDGKPKLGLFNRPLFARGAVRFYYSLRINLGYSLIKKKFKFQDSAVEDTATDRWPNRNL